MMLRMEPQNLDELFELFDDNSKSLNITEKRKTVHQKGLLHRYGMVWYGMVWYGIILNLNHLIT